MDTKQKSIPHSDPFWVEHGYGTRFQGFQNLMRFRIRDILLVASLYDLYVFEQDGRLYELLRETYQGLNLTHSPELTRVSNGVEALRLAQDERRIDLIITTLHIEDMRPVVFARQLQKLKLDIPVVLLAFDNRELSDLLTRKESSVFDQVFIWQGDFQLLLAIIKYLEDRLNIEHDTQIAGVQSILVIEDNIRYYSSFLSLIYLEVMKQTQRLISEGINLSHKQLRRRARPKILLCKTYEQALEYYNKFEETILGIISDIDFPRSGKPNPTAGLDFARFVLSQHADIPILLHSTVPANEEKAREIGASFLLKDSPTLMEDLRDFMMTKLSFGDFVFRMPEGYEVGRASDLLSLENQLKLVPEESIRHHAERNHFSNWLKARTEFFLAYQLRPRKVSDFPSLEACRQDLISSLRDYRNLRQRGIVTEFSKESFDPNSSVSRIGGGSLGGKARGLSFVNILINNYAVHNRFEGIQISVPPALVIGSDVFDQFLAENNLQRFALESTDDREIMRRFLEAKRFPEDILAELAAFLDLEDKPLAVRSSSLLEDSHIHPFSGVYKTYMLPNCHVDPIARLSELIKAIKKVYASTFYCAAKAYIKATSYRLEEEKMAVIIQKMIGSRYADRFYPVFAGVARSYNFYPISPQKSSDGVIAVALGLGKMVVEGGMAVRFSPRYPKHIHQFSNVKEALRNTQNDFFALDLNEQVLDYADTDDCFVKRYSLQHAEGDGTLQLVGSTYSPENNRIYDGITRPGSRLVTFSPILKSEIFPLPEILELLLDMGGWSMGTPVEIEFAVDMSADPDKPHQFAVLQMRPLVLNRDLEVVITDVADPEQVMCHSDRVMGNGVFDNVFDIVLVDRDRFDRAKSHIVAHEVSTFNSRLLAENRPYLLVGVGRWGSLDSWLGIPVTWAQICGARTIIETGFKDFEVTPSQGSHFFQNLNSFLVGYFTVQSAVGNGYIDWDWLLAQPTIAEMEYTRLLRFDKPVVVKMSGHLNKGIILKPES